MPDEPTEICDHDQREGCHATVRPTFGPGDKAQTRWGKEITIAHTEATVMITYVCEDGKIWQGDELVPVEATNGN